MGLVDGGLGPEIGRAVAIRAALVYAVFVVVATVIAGLIMDITRERKCHHENRRKYAVWLTECEAARAKGEPIPPPPEISRCW